MKKIKMVREMNAKKCGCEELEGLWYLCPMHDKQARIAWEKNKKLVGE